MFNVTEVTTREQFQQVRQDWLALWQQTPGATLWQHPDWFELCFLDQPRLGSPLGLLLYTGSELFGLLPLMIQQDRSAVLASAGLPVREFAGPLGTDPTVTLLNCAQYLRTHTVGWDLMEWGAISASGLAGRVNTSLMLSGFLADRTTSDSLAAVDLTRFPCWFEYLRNSSVDLIQDWREAEQILQRLGDWELYWGECCFPQEFPSSADAIRFRRQVEFLQRLQSRFSSRSADCRVELQAITLNDHPVAVSATAQVNGRAWVLPLASRTEFGFAPLRVLVANLVRDAFEEGLDRLSFCEDLPFCLHPWMTEQVHRVHFTAVRPGMLSRWKHFRWKWHAAQSAPRTPISF